MEIKPHHKNFKSTFVVKRKDSATIKYGEKEVTISLAKVKDRKAQAWRNQYILMSKLGTNFPLMSLEKVMLYLYGEKINKGMRSYW